jgi:hypothetical protein
MEKLSFLKFMEAEEIKSSLPNAARVNLGIKKKEFGQALKGMFPTVNSQMILPNADGDKTQIAVAPVDYEISPDGKKASMNIMTDETPYVYVNKRDIYKGGNKKLLLAPSQIDKMVFQGMPLSQPGGAAPGGAPPAMPPG